MKLIKCDICKRMVKNKDKVTDVSLPGFSWHELCEDCAKKYLQPLMKKLGSLYNKESLNT